MASRSWCSGIVPAGAWNEHQFNMPEVPQPEDVEPTVRRHQ
jgi:hypothetical protein